VLVRRCAWHRKYRGYPILYGVASWRGQRVDFTDGLCHGCAARARTELGFPAAGALAAVPRRILAVAAALMLLLAPEVLDQFPPSMLPLPPALRPARLVPPALAVREASAEEPPPPVLDVRAVIAMVTAASGAVDGPESAPPPRPAGRAAPDGSLGLPPPRAALHAYDDPFSPLAAFSVQAP